MNGKIDYEELKRRINETIEILDKELYLQWQPGDLHNQSSQDEFHSEIFEKKSQCHKVLVLHYEFYTSISDEEFDETMMFQLEFLKFSKAIFEYVDIHNRALIHGSNCQSS